MVKENSGRLFSFKLDHNFGYGFAEIYDFTDQSSFSGRIIFVYNLILRKIETHSSIDKIVKSGIALGPITLWKFPNARGKGAWKFITKIDTYIIETYPHAKDLRSLLHLYKDWSKFDKWYISSDEHDPLMYVPYDKVRRLETRILNPKEGVVTKFTMKNIIDSGKKVVDYYDLNELGTRNMYIQLINTYYPQNKINDLIKDIPT